MLARFRRIYNDKGGWIVVCRSGLDPPGVDPDFDDMDADITSMSHEIEASGVVEIHPDGDRLSADFNPVPLHTRDHNTKEATWAQYNEECEEEEEEGKWMEFGDYLRAMKEAEERYHRVMIESWNQITNIKK